MSTHRIRAEIEIEHRAAGSEEIEVAYPLIEISYRFTRWQGPAVDRIGPARLIFADGLTPTQFELDDWADEWLGAGGFETACAAARDDAPEYEWEPA